MAVREHQIRSYLEAIRTGDRKSSDRIAAQVLFENAGLIGQQIQKYRWLLSSLSYHDSKEDLMQAGYIGLLKALKAYNPGRGAFSTIATWKIKHEIQQQICKMQVTTHSRVQQIQSRAYRSDGKDLFESLPEVASDSTLETETEARETLTLLARFASYSPDGRMQTFFAALCCGESAKDSARIAKVTEAAGEAWIVQARAFADA